MDLHVESLQLPVSQKEDGTWVCGPCPCAASLGVVCSHITTVLYALHYAEKHPDNHDGPAHRGLYLLKADEQLHEEESQTDFSKPAEELCDEKSELHIIHPKKKACVSADAIEKFYRALDMAAPVASEKSVLLSVLPEYCDQFQPKTTASDEVLENS